MSQMADGEAITPEGLEALKAELARLEGPARREMAGRIQAARDHGDLKENADYHTAKEDQAHLETRIARLAERLRNARVVAAPTESEAVAFGSTVTIADLDSGREATYMLVGATEADLRAGRLSAESPVARALMGARPGDEVAVETPRGPRRYRVARLG